MYVCVLLTRSLSSSLSLSLSLTHTYTRARVCALSLRRAILCHSRPYSLNPKPCALSLNRALPLPLSSPLPFASPACMQNLSNNMVRDAGAAALIDCAAANTCLTVLDLDRYVSLWVCARPKYIGARVCDVSVRVCACTCVRRCVCVCVCRCGGVHGRRALFCRIDPLA